MTDARSQAVEIVTAYLSRNEMPSAEVPAFLQSIINTLENKGLPVGVPSRLAPPVPIEESVFDDHLICLEDGKPVKMLKRYLRTHFNLSFEEYLAKWNLPRDYPAVCKNYSQSRSEVAKRQGLGKR